MTEMEEIKKLEKKLDKNYEQFKKDVLAFILLQETGVWETKEKPTGTWMKERLLQHFEEPLLDYANENF